MPAFAGMTAIPSVEALSCERGQARIFYTRPVHLRPSQNMFESGPFILLRADLPKAEKAQDKDDDDDEANNVNDVVHVHFLCDSLFRET